jgi:hypothetical protein
MQHPTAQAFLLTGTTLNYGHRVATELALRGWQEVEQAIRSFGAAPTELEVRDAVGDTLLYLIMAGDRVHMVVSHASGVRHCLTTERPELEDAFLYLGWEALPAWSVVQGIDTALRAAHLFIEERKLADWATWREVPVHGQC